MAVDKIRNEIGYQRENQTNIERAGNWLTDSGIWKHSDATTSPSCLVATIKKRSRRYP